MDIYLRPGEDTMLNPLSTPRLVLSPLGGDDVHPPTMR